MPDAAVVSSRERDSLVEKLKADPKFRELMKQDWKKAFREVGIPAEKLEGKNIKYSETVPLQSGPVQAGIVITITGVVADEVELQESVLFTK